MSLGREKVGALCMLVFSIAYGIGAFQIPLAFIAQGEVFTSRTMPYALSVAGIIFSLLILFLPTVDPEGRPTLGEATRGMDWKPAIALVFAMILYGLVMKWLGFVISSIAFLMLGFRVLGETRWKRMIIAAVPLVIVLWVIMAMLLGVYIAPGEIFYMLGWIDV